MKLSNLFLIVCVLISVCYCNNEILLPSFEAALISHIESRVGQQGSCVATLGNYLKDNSSAVGITMIDAMGKIPVGLLRVSTLNLGDYGECMKMNEARYGLVSGGLALSLKKKDSNLLESMRSKMKFEGLKVFKPDSKLKSFGNGSNMVITTTINWGLCVPANCTLDEVAAIVPDVLDRINSINPLFSLTLVPTAVSFPKKPDLDAGAKGAIFLLSFFGSLVLFCSVFHFVYDAWKQLQINQRILSLQEDDRQLLKESLRKEEPPSKFMVAIQSFSVFYNLPRLFSESRETKTLALNGFRVLSMFWVILGHTYLWSLGLFQDSITIVDVYQRFSFQLVANAYFSVDSFFFLSGFLLAFLALKEFKRVNLLRAKFWVLFYFHRIWRITPTYMFVLFIYAKLSYYFIDGPLIDGTRKTCELCNDHWWTNLLYINNFTPSFPSMCMGWSWYLANDMQFFFISPLLLVSYHFSKILGWIVLSIFFIATWVTTAVLVKVKDIQPSLTAEFVQPNTSSADYADIIYSKPYTRISPYLVGIGLAFIYSWLIEGEKRVMMGLITVKEKRVPNEIGRENGHVQRETGSQAEMSVEFNAFFNLGGILLSGFLMCLVVFATYSIADGGQWSEAVNVLYTTVARFAWSLGMAFITLSCMCGQGGWINTVLSLSPFTALSRLTFAAYLIHPLILSSIFGAFANGMYYNDFHWTIFFLGAITSTYAFAIVVVLLVEMPFTNLEKVFLKRG